MSAVSAETLSESGRLLDYFPFQEIRLSQQKALAVIEGAKNQGKKFALLELPTGSGKSAVAIAAAKWASSWGSGAYILSPQKTLTRQYMRDFSGEGLVELRGRASYRCDDFKTNCEIGGSLRKRDIVSCSQCPYKLAKDQFLSEKLGVTNFDYFLAETLYSGQLPRRSMLIIDEAHNLEQKILSFTDFEISPFTLQKYSIAYPTIEDGDVASAAEWIEHEMIPAVRRFISETSEEEIFDSDDRRAAENLLRRMRGFLGGEHRDWAFWNSGKKLVFRPLEAGKFAAEFLFSRADMIVIMSATILSFKVFRRVLDIADKDCETLAVPSEFPVRIRPIFYRPLGSMNFHNKQKTLPKIADAMDKLLRARSDLKGLIHTNSYEMNRALTRILTAAGHQDRIITHEPRGAERALERHTLSDGPTVLCSPAMTEGIDLRDDLSRFQVVIKVPYPNLKDPYVAERKKRDRGWYSWQTAMRLIQATGRSVRSGTDYAQTFIVDSDFEKFRKQNSRLLPTWWLDAIIERAEKKKPPEKATPVDLEREQEVF